MGFAVFACLALVVLTTLLHYEALRVIGAVLPRLRMVPRGRLIVVILGTFAAHALEGAAIERGPPFQVAPQRQRPLTGR